MFGKGVKSLSQVAISVLVVGLMVCSAFVTIAGARVDAPNDSSEPSNPSINAWSAGADMPLGRFWYALASAENNTSFYVMGGMHPGPSFSTALYRYDSNIDTWTTLNPMPQTRIYHSAVCYNNTIYVVGG